MNLVTIADITLHRPLSASGRGAFSPANPQREAFLIVDGQLQTVKAMIERFAEKCGVNSGSLSNLRQVRAEPFGLDTSYLVFDIDTQGAQYSTLYATCLIFPALAVGQRYFKLTEVVGISEA